MFRFAVILLTLMTLLAPVCYGEIIYAPEGWVYVGYPAGDVVFALPEDYGSMEITSELAAEGYIERGGNGDFTLQIKAYSPDEITYDEFVRRMTEERPVELNEKEAGGIKSAWYVRKDATPTSEFIGIVITGSDGRLYRLSIFAAEENQREGSAAYEAGMTIAETLRIWEMYMCD